MNTSVDTGDLEGDGPANRVANMRLVNVGSNYRVAGGADRYALGLEALLEKHGHRVLPFAARHPENREAETSGYFPPGVAPDAPSPADVARFVYSRRAREQMARLVSEHDPDLAHLHVYYGQLTASILRPLREAGVPTVQTLHDFKLGCPVRIFVSRGEVCEACGGEHFWRALPRRCNRGSFLRTAVSVLESYVSRALGDDEVDHFVAPSRFLRDKMVEHEIVDPAAVTVLPNFVDADRFLPGEGIGDHFVYFGRLRSVKGVGTLIEAAAPLEEHDLYIVGSGPEREEFERTVERRGLDHVHFLGYRDGEALHEVVRNARASIVPSELYENCPMTVLESMALATPVLGSEIGGIPELVRDGEDGFLVPPADPEALREKMAWMAENSRRAVEMGVAGRDKVERRHGPERHYEGLLDIYRRVL